MQKSKFLGREIKEMIFQSFIRQTVKFLTFKIEKYIGGVLSLFAL